MLNWKMEIKNVAFVDVVAVVWRAKVSERRHHAVVITSVDEAKRLELGTEASFDKV